MVYALKSAMRQDCAFKLSPTISEILSLRNESLALVTKPLIVENKILDWKSQTKELDEILHTLTGKQLENALAIDMPLHFRPSIKLFDYQIEGIRWLVHQETSSKAVPFFKREYENKRWVSIAFKAFCLLMNRSPNLYTHFMTFCISAEMEL